MEVMGPKEFECFNTDHTNNTILAIEKINDRLNDMPMYVDIIRGERVPVNKDEFGNFIEVIIPDFGLTGQDEMDLNNSFVKAGWKYTAYVASIENGEKTGLILVRLYFRN